MVTLLELKDQSRQRADMVNSDFISDAELTSYINNSYAELYDILVQTDEDYYLNILSFTISSGSTTYDLPADFYKLKGLDRSLSGGTSDGDWITVQQYTFAERNRNNRLINNYYSDGINVRYRVTANQIRIMTEDNAAGNYRLWYIPKYVPLTVDADTLDGVNGFEEYVIVDAAIKMLQKEESDVSVLMAQKQGLIRRIQAMSADRDFGAVEKVGDVTAWNNPLRLLGP